MADIPLESARQERAEFEENLEAERQEAADNLAKLKRDADKLDSVDRVIEEYDVPLWLILRS